MFKRIANQAKKFWSDEQGAEGLEKLLIVGAIILPLLGILIFFKEEITDWVEGIWGDVENDNQDYEYDGGGF